MGLKVFLPSRPGVHNTAGKTHLYDSFADFVEAVQQPTALADSTPGSKKALPYFVGGEVVGKRHDANVLSRTLLTLDIEAKRGGKTQPPPPRDVIQTLKESGQEFWLYTTASHTRTAPRYRIVLPLRKPITADVDKLQAATLQAAALAGVEEWCQPESWVLSQPMYLPAKVGTTAPVEGVGTGKPFAPTGKATKDAPADIPDAPVDPVLRALQRAGLYLHEDPKQTGKHYIRCPHADDHGTVNDTQTVYYEAHHDGNPRPAVKCLDTDADHDGVTHLTYGKLVNWLREGDWLTPTDENPDTAQALDDPECFWASTDIQHMLDTPPKPLEFVFKDFAPAGRVTVLAGPGGVSKSSLALRLLLSAATGSAFGPFVPDKAMRCMYLSYEDDEQTFHNRLRRMYDALESSDEAMLYDMPLARKNLRIKAVAGEPSRWVLMRKDGRFGNPEPTTRLRWLATLLKNQGVRLLVLDPVAYTHLLEENDPGEMALFMQAMGRVAEEANCAIVLLHHMHKAAQWATLDDINQGSLRGASSLSDNARSVAVLVSLSQRDAPTFGLPATHETVGRYAVMKHIKHNYSRSLGVHVFEREGALLVPTAVRPITPEERQKLREQNTATRTETKRNMKVLDLLQWLSKQKNQQANRAAIDAGFFKGAKDRHNAVQFCIDQRLIDAPAATAGKPRVHSLTEHGLDYLESGDLEEID